MTAANAILLALVISAAGALITLLFSKNKTVAGWISFFITTVAGFLAIYSAATVLVSGHGTAVTILSLPAAGSAFRIYVDGLSAIFLGLIATIAILSAFFSISYMEHYKEYGVARYYPYFLLFVAGMYGIVTVTDMMLFFFFFWQLMTLSSYALVRYEYKKRGNVRAANKYLIMMQIACLLIIIASAMLAESSATIGTETVQKYDFDAISHGLPGLLQNSSGLATIAFLLYLVGFGIKAGMWPFGQMWLPDAHPAAPSPISSLLSGVMIKTGIYGLLRSFLWLIPESALPYYPNRGWGLIIAVIGTITLFIGTMQALKQEQSKRLLAFHSIGQVGYILLGLGACIALISSGWRNEVAMGLAAIAFYGAIFHTINHGTFKSLLFLNAGSMLYATDTQDLNKLGGLIKYMPVTAVMTLIASFSIAGVPLFNGFASKWSIYVATILGSSIAPYLGVCALFAILTSAITLASFMKFFGVSFLTRTSALVAQKASRTPLLEVNWMMQFPQLILAALCLVFGIIPIGAYQLIEQALDSSQQGLAAGLAKMPLAHLDGIAGIASPGSTALFDPLVLIVVLGILFTAAMVISRLGGAERKVDEPWLCGYAQDAEQHRYGAHHLYSGIKRYFRWIGGKPGAHL
jgi:formate hydrogenlyase subunit 3/multisubunit Na+/H+ antiporter MnhD subunit